MLSNALNCTPLINLEKVTPDNEPPTCNPISVINSHEGIKTCGSLENTNVHLCSNCFSFFKCNEYKTSNPEDIESSHNFQTNSTPSMSWLKKCIIGFSVIGTVGVVGGVMSAGIIRRSRASTEPITITPVITTPAITTPVITALVITTPAITTARITTQKSDIERLTNNKSFAVKNKSTLLWDKSRLIVSYKNDKGEDKTLQTTEATVSNSAAVKIPETSIKGDVTVKVQTSGYWGWTTLLTKKFTVEELNEKTEGICYHTWKNNYEAGIQDHPGTEEKC